MPYPPAAIANKFWELANRDQRMLSPMQVQKLVYFAHGWHLALELGPLSSEPAQAWLYGPVFPSLYHALKIWGGRRIQEPIRISAFIENKKSLAIIGRTWKLYGGLSAIALSNRSHDSKGPWHRIRLETDGNRFAEIPNDLIREYFTGLKNADSSAS